MPVKVLLFVIFIIDSAVITVFDVSIPVIVTVIIVSEFFIVFIIIDVLNNFRAWCIVFDLFFFRLNRLDGDRLGGLDGY